MSNKKMSFSGISTINILVFSFFSCLSNHAQNQNLNADDFEKQLIATKGEQLIDVRTPQEFERYRIKSAKNINVNSAAFRKEIEKLDKNKPVLVYCLSGARSSSAVSAFRNAGFKTVYHLSGGLNAWSKVKKPIDEDLSGKGELSSQEYAAIISSKGYVLVDFFAPWCGPCRAMLPIVEDLANTYPDKFILLTVDFDQNRLLARQQNITSVPYLAVYKDGKKIWDRNGPAGKEELLEILNIVN